MIAACLALKLLNGKRQSRFGVDFCFFLSRGSRADSSRSSARKRADGSTFASAEDSSKDGSQGGVASNLRNVAFRVAFSVPRNHISLDRDAVDRRYFQCEKPRFLQTARRLGIKCCNCMCDNIFEMKFVAHGFPVPAPDV